MISPGQDLQFITAAVEDLESFILSKEIYWPLPGINQAYPRLSLGTLLLSLCRLEGSPLAPRQLDQFTKISAEVNQIHARWQVHWENKAKAEFPVRLRLWSNYLDDYAGDPGGFCQAYPQEVERRVILHLLIDAGKIAENELLALASLDRLLQKDFIPGNFVWESALQAQFTQDPFWYLYGHLKPCTAA